MVKQRKVKLGLFSSRGKASFQDNLRLDKLSKLQSKKSSDLSKKEKALLSGPSAVRGKFSSKAGFYGAKQPRRYDEVSIQGSGATGFGPALNVNAMLNTSTTIPISSMIKQSPTGIYSQKDVGVGVKSFVSQLQSAPSIGSVSVRKKNDKIIGVDINRDFQKASFVFNPKQVAFSTKGWGVDIPDEYIKVSDTHYKAPTKSFTDSYYKKKSNGKKKTDIRYSTYNPVELFLQNGGKKISKIIKKDVYKKDEFSLRDDDYSKRTYDNVIFTSQSQDFFDTGLLKQRKDWDDYTKYEEIIRDEDYKRKEIEKEIFLKDQWDYNKGGFLKEYKHWDDYKSNVESKRDDERYRYDQTRKKTFLQDQQQYTDVGKLSRKRRWDDYITKEKDKHGSWGRESETDRKTFLRTDEFYTDGLKTRSDKYSDYLSGVDENKFRDVQRRKDRKWENIASESVFNKDPTAKQFVDKEGKTDWENLRLNEGQITKLVYDTGIKSQTFYNPYTGEVVEKYNYW